MVKRHMWKGESGSDDSWGDNTCEEEVLKRGAAPHLRTPCFIVAEGQVEGEKDPKWDSPRETLTLMKVLLDFLKVQRGIAKRETLILRKDTSSTSVKSRHEWWGLGMSPKWKNTHLLWILVTSTPGDWNHQAQVARKINPTSLPLLSSP